MDNEMEDCPHCENVGWYAQEDTNTGEPMQIQCEWCYTNPYSKFNFDNGNIPEPREDLEDV